MLQTSNLVCDVAVSAFMKMKLIAKWCARLPSTLTTFAYFEGESLFHSSSLSQHLHDELKAQSAMSHSSLYSATTFDTERICKAAS